MLIAKTQEESDLLCDQEISHIFMLPKRPRLFVDDDVYKCVYEKKAYAIPEDMYIFMQSDEYAMEHLSNLMFDIDQDKSAVLKRRSLLTSKCSNGNYFIDELIKYGRYFQSEKNNASCSLFGESLSNEIKKPIPTEQNDVSELMILQQEKEVLGVYLTAHPLDFFKDEIKKHVIEGHIRTKKYGTLVYFERIRDMLDSKYNKGVLCVYCSSVKYESKKKYTLKTCNIETQEESYEFRDKESSDNNFSRVFMDSEYETNKIKEIEPFSVYLIVIQRDVSSMNGVRIIDSYKINKN